MTLDNLIAGILSSAIFECGRFFIFKMLFNGESHYHYKKLYEGLKIIAYMLRLWVMMCLFSFLESVGMVRPVPKETQTKILIAVVMMVAIVALVAYIQSQNKNDKQKLN